MLASARREYDAQQRLTALAVAEALRLAPRGSMTVARVMQAYQASAIVLALEYMAALLAEQSIDDTAQASVVPASMLTGVQAMATMLSAAQTEGKFVALVQTLVRDADRTARATDMATRPAVTGWVRSLQVPSCKRCVPLAGRVYHYSQGFERHPKCDCLMTPTTKAAGMDLITDPKEAFDRGWITDLTVAETEALHAGADLGQVVNVRRKAAGLIVGSSVMVRSGRLTPQGALHFASDRTQALELLRRFGYIL